MGFLSGRTSLTTVQTGDIAASAITSALIADGTIVEADIADNAVTLAKMAGGTDGNLIGIDASGDPAYIATGNDGQVLTSGGVNVAALMEDAAGGGAWNLISTTTISGTPTTVDFESIGTTYTSFAAILKGITGSSGGETLGVRFGTGSTTYETSSYSYRLEKKSVAATTYVAVVGSAVDRIVINHALKEDNWRGHSGVVMFPDLTHSTVVTNHRKIVLSDGFAYDQGANVYLGLKSSGIWDTGTLITAIRFIISANTFANNGVISLYGISK